MRKKQEFKPDKTGSGLLNKLYLTRKQRRSLLHWGLYALTLLILSVLQDVILCRLRLFGAAAEVVPCAIFLICLLEGTEKGSVFALIASLLYLFSGTAAGPYVMVILTFLGIFVTIIRQAYLQRGFVTAMVCTFGALVVYELAVFCFGLFLGLTYPGRVWGFLLTAVMSFVFAPALYPVLNAIGRLGGEVWKE